MIESPTTRNGITAGDMVVFVRKSSLYPRQNNMAQGTLRANKKYKVSWVFLGNDFDQIELSEHDDTAFVHDMFIKLP
ncbi:MAG: hypothetical protein VW683_00245 [Betaproteobacteria bacterium]|jgi:hypothetical protein